MYINGKWKSFLSHKIIKPPPAKSRYQHSTTASTLPSCLVNCVQRKSTFSSCSKKPINMSDAQAVLSEIGKFNKDQMKHVDVEERAVLPDREQVESERKEVQLRQEIEQDHQLHHVNVEEKVLLPSSEVIAQEKQEMQLRQEIEGDHSLKHVSPCVRNSLPDAETIAQEKKAMGHE